MGNDKKNRHYNSSIDWNNRHDRLQQTGRKQSVYP